VKFPPPGLARGLVVLAGACSGQVAQPPAGAPSYVQINLPREVASENVWIRYRLGGEEFGGWVQPRPGLSSYIISTDLEGSPATGIKALIYAPGCAIQTLDLLLSRSNSRQFTCECLPLKSVWIVGRLARSDRHFKRDLRLQVKYVARWARTFLGLADDLVVDIPVGDGVYLPAEGLFRLSVPDLLWDELAGAPDHPGEFQVWAKDGTSGDLLALLTPFEPAAMQTRMGGLRIVSAYPPEIVFASCRVVGSPLVHDARGFAIRPEPGHPCELRW
jgi:hypothetical protein